MFGHQFYNETTRRCVAVFGSLFNDIIISRKNNSGETVQTMKVPVNYGPIQKFLSKLEQDPNLSAPAITLPRISFEISGITYDGERALTSIGRHKQPKSDNASEYNIQFTPTPYNIEFQLNIMTKYTEDGSKILEQIIPFFRPDFTPSVKLVDELDMTFDIPVILNSITTEDTYEGSYDDRRALIWTLNFTMKSYFFGPVTSKKVIKFVETGAYGSLENRNFGNIALENVKVQPGLTSEGNPTTDINETIPYLDINAIEDWDYIVRVEDAV